MAAAADLSSRFQLVEARVGERLLERRRIIRSGMVAILAEANHLQLGGVGEGKSMLPGLIAGQIEGCRYHEFLLDKFMSKDELFGPQSLKALEDDRFARNLSLYAADADIVFFDELFTGSAAILQTLNWFLNERKIRDDGQIKSLDLVTAFSAANEGPQARSLQAVDDRLEVRVMTKPVQQSNNFIAMLQTRTRHTLEPVLTMEDVRDAHIAVDAVQVGDDIYEAMDRLRLALLEKSFRPSDRRFWNAVRLVQAFAFLEGRGAAEIDDLRILRDALWTTPDQRELVEEKVISVCGEIEQKAHRLLRDVEAFQSEIDKAIAADNRAVRLRKGTILRTKLDLANDQLVELQTLAAKQSSGYAILGEIDQRIQSLAGEVLRGCFGKAYNPRQTEEEG